MTYTRVHVDSVKGDRDVDGLQIVLVARGASLPDVTDIVRVHGVPFDLLTLRYAARALLDRLNANLETERAVQALVGTEVDVTSPLPPRPAVADPPGMI